MQARVRRAPVRKPSDVKTTAKTVSLAVTMEGAVEVKKGENGTDYAIGVGVGIDGARVSLSFFQEAIEKAFTSLNAGSSCSGVRDFLWGRNHGSCHGVFPGRCRA